MANLIDETGNIYGRLIVVKKVAKPHNHKTTEAFWLCICDTSLGGCGNESTIMGSDLRRGHARSCGCYNSEVVSNRMRGRIAPTRLPRGYSSMRTVLNTYKYYAKKRGYIFEIDEFQFIHLTQERCHYCNKSPSSKRMDKTSRNGAYIYQGIDRVDNTKGYTLDNVVPCCATCNKMKSEMTEDEWLSHMKSILLNRGVSV